MTDRTSARRRTPLVWQVFISILLIALSSVLVAGVLIRRALDSTFAAYLLGLPDPTGTGRGMGRRLLGAAEQSFMTNVDRSMWIAALIAIVIAALGALVLARRISLPLSRLTSSATRFAQGALDERVDASGPREVGELADAFNEMADSLSEAEVLRRRLVADVAHELRNPVAALRAQLEGVAEGVLEMDDARAVSLVADVKQLSRLVEDLQTLSVAEAGRLSYLMEQFDVVEVVDTEIERAMPHLHQGVSIAVNADAQPHQVDADASRVGSVVRNLLSNAVRHTHDGSIVVTVRAAGELVHVEVTDTGEGIPSEDLPFIFERFYRADSARAQDTGGAGIGLAIAKRIIEDLGGSMYASSEPGHGATVGFDLPSAAKNEPAA